MKTEYGTAGLPLTMTMLPEFSVGATFVPPPPPPAPPAELSDVPQSTLNPNAPCHGSPGRMQVLANGDIIDCGRLPQTARNNLYKTELCKHFMDTGACRYGSKCQFAHGEHELRGVLRHPKYKTTRCKAFVSTGKCMYGNRCRFIHGDNPEDDSFSSTGSESDDQDSPLKDLMVNPYVHGTELVDLRIPFSGMKQVTLAPLTSTGRSSASPGAAPIDSFLFRDPFAVPDLHASPSKSLAVTSPSVESASARFSRLSIFQRICREDA